MLEELANIVGRFGLSEKQRKEVSGSDVALCPDQVGAWLFKPNRRPRGSVVEEIRLDDSGLYRPGFDEVATALHNDWAEISSRLVKRPFFPSAAAQPFEHRGAMDDAVARTRWEAQKQRLKPATSGHNPP